MKQLMLASAVALSVMTAQANEVCDSYQSSTLNQSNDVTAIATNVGNSSKGSEHNVSGSSNNSQALVIDDEDIAVTVTGNVKKHIETDVVITGRGRIATTELQSAPNVEVRFWKTSKPSVYVSTMTDDNGNYRVELSNGEWQGEACGAVFGFSPSAWQVSLKNNKLINMQEVTLAAPTLSASLVSLQQFTDSRLNKQTTVSAKALSLKVNEELVVDGSGFGCNGSLVFEFQNSVATFGDVNAVEYNHQPIVKNNYCSRNDQQIRLPMPSLYDAQVGVGNHADSSRYALLYYQKGNYRSNAIYVSEFLSLPILKKHKKNTDKFKNTESVNNLTNQLKDLLDTNNVGALGNGGLFGGRGFAGGVGNNPFNGGSGGSFNQFSGNQNAIGFNARAFNTGNLSTDSLNLNVDNINIQRR